MKKAAIGGLLEIISVFSYLMLDKYCFLVYYDYSLT